MDVAMYMKLSGAVAFSPTGGGFFISRHRDPGLFPKDPRMPRWSNVHVDPCSHLRHWRCVLDTAAEQRASKQPPHLFSMYTPTPPRYISRHCPISQRRRASSAAEKALFYFLYFSSALETTIFLLTCRSATLPMGARGGTCVIDAPRRIYDISSMIFTQK